MTDNLAALPPSARYDLLIFDWDGTLYDSTGTIVNSIRMACQQLSLPIPTIEQARWVIGLSFEQAILKIVPTLRTEDFPDFLTKYRQLYFSDHGVTLFDGILEMLQGLHARGIQLAIATGKSRIGLDRVLKETQLKNLFSVTRCADETASKPHPLMLHEILQVCALPANRALMIGDTSHDIRMAQAVPMDVVAVSYGAHAEQELLALNPYAFAPTVSQLNQLLTQVCS